MYLKLPFFFQEKQGATGATRLADGEGDCASIAAEQGGKVFGATCARNRKAQRARNATGEQREEEEKKRKKKK